ncbi:hypothetical protein SAMN02745121_06678 [Nannocystis exedens]|uniref:Uncharacterized protein n=1 Tax=Nannocystis exedens TaxID=54 RepID=A0A1I2FIF4_9BACT|nr:hypothetical protein [Nannocystis exedens]PCC70414.1 hypothetical protein NAEX_03457 [Nannocystis exedens]SFF04669.1 hypothetical protein SAMN02745121_06678 [Nannocystis exedens]
MLSPRLAAIRAPILVIWLAAAVLAAIDFLRDVDPAHVRLALFIATVVVEVLALATAMAGRRALADDDPTRGASTAICLGLGLRVAAELRLGLMYLSAVPSVILKRPALADAFLYGLRYLYVAADLALLLGVVRTLRGLRCSGLGIRPRPRDLLVILLVVPLPLAVYALQAQVVPAPSDTGIITFRLLAASVGAVVGGYCVVLAVAALQLGGAWAWIWGAAGVAGIARALAFVAAAAAEHVLPRAGAILLEQGLLWTFACAWLLATALHWQHVRRS